MADVTSLLSRIEEHIIDYFQEHIPEKYEFHDLEHTQNVVNACQEIGIGLNLSRKEISLLEIAAWFHDTGYSHGPQGHEERSVENCMAFLKNEDLTEIEKKTISNCILATKLPHAPANTLEKIICDADMSHLGKRIYWTRVSKLRQEIVAIKDQNMSDEEWIDFELDFLSKHNYHTDVAKVLYDQDKAKHIRQLLKQKKRLSPDVIKGGELRMNKALELGQLNLGRGVETMYRTTYRTHVNLSSIADNKANIMLSINAIIVSIIISTLVPQLSVKPELTIPTIILLAVCLLSIVFATLSTRPKITEGKVSKENIENKTSNLLFFGNYYNMPLQEFHWGMMEMIKDQEFLYSSMTRDLYYLGIVLAKKYRYLRICYSVFMFGLILAVLAYAVVYLIK